jgi:integrase
MDGTRGEPRAQPLEDRALAGASALRSSGGRPATGSIVWEDPETKTKPIGVRVTKANGKRTVVRFDPGTMADDARLLAPILAERARFAVAEGAGETVAQYAERWCNWRDSRGLGCVAKDRVKLARHVFPMLGAFEVAAVSRDDLKRFVAALDARASAGFHRTAGGQRLPFGWKTAVNVWSTVRALFRDACGAKRVDLCVLDANPASGVAGPDTGARKAKTYLWPSEFGALVGCDGVPVRWRRLVALAVYTFARAGELAALRWDDVDLEHGTIHIHRSTDGARDRTKPTKTDAARRIPIEPALLPLLRAMHDEADGRGNVVRLPSSGKQSSKLKHYLARAGVSRTDLFVSDATRKALTFHDLRATGITWMAVRGDDALKIMQRAGHAGFDTTRIYMREAENLSHAFGEVFPALPVDLFKRSPKGWAGARGVSAPVLAFRRRQLHGAARNAVQTVGAGGFEPPTPRPPV